MSIWLRSFHPFLCAYFHVQLYLFRLPHTYPPARTLALPTQILIGQEYSIMICFLFLLPASIGSAILDGACWESQER